MPWNEGSALMQARHLGARFNKDEDRTKKGHGIEHRFEHMVHIRGFTADAKDFVAVSL